MGLVKLLFKHGALPYMPKHPVQYKNRPLSHIRSIIDTVRDAIRLGEWKPWLATSYLPSHRKCMRALLLLAKSEHV